MIFKVEASNEVYYLKGCRSGFKSIQKSNVGDMFLDTLSFNNYILYRKDKNIWQLLDIVGKASIHAKEKHIVEARFVCEGSLNKIYNELSQIKRTTSENFRDYITVEKQLTLFKIIKNKKQEGELKMRERLVNYFNKNEDFLMSLGIIIVIDHFILEGSLREKIKQLIESMLNKIDLPTKKELTDDKK